MILIMCATPYHLINAINIAKMEECETDIVLYNHFKDSKELVNRLKIMDVFNNVILFDENNYSFMQKCKRLVNSFFPSRLIRDIANKKVYNKIIFFSLDFINIAYIIKKYTRRNIKCEFAYGDDGIGTYIDSRAYTPSSIVSKILKLNGNKKWLDEIHDLYVTTPQLINNTIYNLHEIKCNIESIEYIKKLWHIDTNDIRCKYVYLQEPIPGSRELDEKVISILEKHVGEKGYIIKLHPREQDWQLEKDNIIDSQIPFERVAADIKEETLTLISIFSTAAITPVLLYKKKIRIIFLYNLSSYIQNGNYGILDLCNQIKKIYNIQILAPKSIEELEKYIGEKNE